MAMTKKLTFTALGNYVTSTIHGNLFEKHVQLRGNRKMPKFRRRAEGTEMGKPDQIKM